MFIELIDLLRCTRPHEDSWLVAAFHEMRERDVIEGLLSCPVCGARYPITNGVAWFDVEPGVQAQRGAAPLDDGMRVAAYLHLVEPGVVVLGGGWVGAADAVTELGNTVIALNSSSADAPRVSRVRCDRNVPLARECLDGIALDAATAGLVEGGAGALRNGARMVAPVGESVPDGLAEIARDERYWIAARVGVGASKPVQIARR